MANIKRKIAIIRLSSIYANLDNESLDLACNLIKSKFPNDFIVLIFSGENETTKTIIEIIDL